MTVHLRDTCMDEIWRLNHHKHQKEGAAALHGPSFMNYLQNNQSAIGLNVSHLANKWSKLLQLIRPQRSRFGHKSDDTPICDTCTNILDLEIFEWNDFEQTNPTQREALSTCLEPMMGGFSCNSPCSSSCIGVGDTWYSGHQMAMENSNSKSRPIGSDKRVTSLVLVVLGLFVFFSWSNFLSSVPNENWRTQRLGPPVDVVGEVTTNYCLEIYLWCPSISTVLVIEFIMHPGRYLLPSSSSELGLVLLWPEIFY